MAGNERTVFRLTMTVTKGGSFRAKLTTPDGGTFIGRLDTNPCLALQSAWAAAGCSDGYWPPFLSWEDPGLYDSDDEHDDPSEYGKRVYADIVDHTARGG